MPTWAQKKKKMAEFIEAHYAGALRAAGFVSFKNEGFHWYKVENGLLKKVHLPIFSPAMPLFLSVGYGVVPLFSYEKIAPTEPFRDWPWEMEFGNDHVESAEWAAKNHRSEEITGRPCRETYFSSPSICYWSGDICLMHLNSEKCGAEVLDDVILPVLGHIRSVEDLYRRNKRQKLLGEGRRTEDGYLARLESGYMAKNKQILRMSLTFADQCLYCRDEKFYPAVLYFLKKYLSDSLPGLRSAPDVKKERLQRLADAEAHAETLISVIENDDRSLFEEECGRVRGVMLRQIEKALPDLEIALS